jgi:hypothetical protein
MKTVHPPLLRLKPIIVDREASSYHVEKIIPSRASGSRAILPPSFPPTMPVQKLFDTTNQVGSQVTYQKGTTTIATQKTGGVCLTMVLTWIQAAQLKLAQGRPMAETEGEITGPLLQRVAFRHHMFRFKTTHARENNLGEEALDEIRADYLKWFSLQEANSYDAPNGSIAGLGGALATLEQGYHVLIIFRPDPAEGSNHSFGLKVNWEGTSYFLDPNSGLYSCDNFFEDFLSWTENYLKVNYIQRGYAGGTFAAERLTLG